MQYQFVVNKLGVMYMCMQPCWCLYCMVALTASTLEWTGISYIIPDCITLPHTCPSASELCDKSTNLYTLYHQECLKNYGPVVAR